MDETGLIQWIIGQTGMAGLAGFAIWRMQVWHSESANRHAERLAEEIRRGAAAIERERQDKEILVTTLGRNTDASTRLYEAITRIDNHISNLSKRVDNIS